MLIPPATLRKRWSLKPKTIVHVGGHHAEELEDYLAEGWGATAVLWVEAMHPAAEAIRKRIAHLPQQRVVEAVVWNRAGETLLFHETSNGQSSSVLQLKTHAMHYPEIVVTHEEERITSALQDLIDWEATPTVDLLNLDIQGAELQALVGLGPFITRVNAIYSEINIEELYDGCALLPQMDAWLAQHNFVRLDTELTPQGWGDALWIRRDCLPTAWRARRIRNEAPLKLRQARDQALALASRIRRSLPIP